MKVLENGKKVARILLCSSLGHTNMSSSLHLGIGDVSRMLLSLLSYSASYL